MSRRRRALFALPLAAALVFGCILSERAARAAIGARASIEMAREALALEPGDPSLHEFIGLQELRGAHGAEGYRAPIAHISRALELRPTSPYAWAAFAEAAYEAGVADATFRAALGRAAELGPNEPEVQNMAAFYGLAIWDELDDPTRAALEKLIGNGARRDPQSMLTIAERRGRLAIACRYVPPTARLAEQWTLLCKRTEAK